MLLGSASYDPAAVVSKATSSLLAMTALDTTNLRIVFTAPANGAVLVRMQGAIHGATTFPTILLGVMSGATVVRRVSPLGALKGTALATAQVSQEAAFVVTGLTPGAQYTWDAAYAVQVLLAATGLKYGGPNDATTDNAFGAFLFEIWEARDLLGGICYDPATAAQGGTGLLAMTALDTTNLRLTFTPPPSGRVMVRVAAPLHGAATFAQIMLGVLQGSTVIRRVAPLGGLKTTAVATAQVMQEAVFAVSGLTPGTPVTWDAAHGREITVAASLLKWGGPDNTTGNNAFGGVCFEVWVA